MGNAPVRFVRLVPQPKGIYIIFFKKKYHNIIKWLCKADKQSDAANDISYDISMIL